MINKPINSDNKPVFGKIEILLICCIVFQLIICLIPLHYGDGYIRDELYEMALSTHLAWGYVDVPPLAPFVLAIVRHLFGSSLFAVRLLPTIIGSLVIVLGYRMVKIFGGGFLASLLSLIPVTFAAIDIGAWYNYDRFNILIWNLLIYFLIKLFSTEDKKYWIYIGIIGGFGLLTKWTILFLGLGIVMGLLITTDNKHSKYRIHFTYPQFWVAGLIAFLMLTPYLIWNYHHEFITFQFYKYYSLHKLVPMSVFYYLKSQIFNPFFAVTPVWLSGLYYFLFHKNAQKYRVLGVIYIIVLLVCIIQHSRPDVVAPYYLVLIAAGAVYFESIFKKHKFMWVKVIYVIFILAFSFYLLPVFKPILPLKTYIKYYGNGGTGEEHFNIGKLPQNYADRFGWDEITKKVANVYYSLPPKERSEACIFAGNYGVASAIYFFGRKYGLPKPICPCLQYYIWGPGDNTGEITIWINEQWLTVKEARHWFRSVKVMDKTDNKYCLPMNNNALILLCKDPYMTFKERWKSIKGLS